ncbi:hypothetical protein FRW55_00220 [Mycoplasma anserisalpingitidis]|uniref:Lipoprotein n=1 Tax=Mycoplasma anserisalpingitidis TaxID=519450 RepID=A0A5B8JZ93_9MOLU|nr:aromatic motif membrane protein [Mycoplasma anserisalpingitidis]QDY86598.1 hypothetical protein FRW55_00220 [Mycoplasma anserisalpingitidis]
MRFKKLLFVLPLFSLIPISTVSCQDNNEAHKNIKQKLYTEEYKLNQNWENFLNQEVIEKILNLIYKDSNDKQDFINNQLELNKNKNYLNQIKKSLIFSNNISLSFGHDGGFLSKRPYLLSDSIKNVEEAKTKNWLWLLFNIAKIEFVSFPVFDQFVSSTEESSLEAKKSGMELGLFYTPKSNIFIDFTYKIEIEKDYSETYQFYLLTNEGFIINLNITKYIDNYSWEFENIINNDGEDFIDQISNLINSIDDESDRKNELLDIFNRFKPVHDLYKSKINNLENLSEYRVEFDNYSSELTKFKNKLAIWKGSDLSELHEPTKAEEPKKDEVELFSYLYIYPKVFFSKDKNGFFDIRQYVKNTITFSEITENNQTNNIIYNDYYGGRPIRYTFFDIKI